MGSGASGGDVKNVIGETEQEKALALLYEETHGTGEGGIRRGYNERAAPALAQMTRPRNTTFTSRTAASWPAYNADTT